MLMVYQIKLTTNIFMDIITPKNIKHLHKMDIGNSKIISVIYKNVQLYSENKII